jgi:hypothetical protein
MKLIAFTGPAGAGKDTAGQHVAKYGFRPFAFADPIRAAIASAFNLPMNVLTDRDKKEEVIAWIGQSPRQLMQTFGSEWGRQRVADDIWLRTMANKLDRCAIHGCGAVITDVRFDNEAEFIRARGGIVVRITRPANEAGTASAHVSEAGVSERLIHHTIANDGSLADLLHKVGQLPILRNVA